MTDDPYQAEAGRLRSLVQEQLRLDLTPAARPGWNERTATPLDDSEG